MKSTRLKSSLNTRGSHGRFSQVKFGTGYLAIKKWFAFSLLAIFFSCEEEEFISQRDYPFVESLEITQINDEGATVQFGVRQSGRLQITGYGVRYIEQERENQKPKVEEYFVSDFNGEVDSDLLSMRLNYDLILLRTYIAKPFVKVGNTFVFGEALEFQSLGNQPPKIDSVSNSTLGFESFVEIYGNFFHTRKSENQLTIAGKGENYEITTTESSHKKLVFFVKQKGAISSTSEKFDLVLTVGGKSIEIPDFFSIGFPAITDISPRQLYVGEPMKIQLQTSVVPHQFNLLLKGEEEKIGYLNFDQSQTGQEVNTFAPNLPQGTYQMHLEGSVYANTFPETIEILASWQTIQDNISGPEIFGKKVHTSQNYFLAHDGFPYGETALYALKSGENSFQELTKLPNSQYKGRSGPLSAWVDDRFFYYGLGVFIEQQDSYNFKDFHSFDIQTNQWKQLADFPFDLSGVTHAFSFQKKLYVIMNNYLNFRIYEPSTDTWSISEIQVPNELRHGQIRVDGDQIFVLQRNHQNAQVYRYPMGQNPQLLTSLQFLGPQSISIEIYNDNYLIIGNGPRFYSINRETLKVAQIQEIDRAGLTDYIPWHSSEGFLAGFPSKFNENNKVNSILKLNQPFE